MFDFLKKKFTKTQEHNAPTNEPEQLPEVSQDTALIDQAHAPQTPEDPHALNEFEPSFSHDVTEKRPPETTPPDPVHTQESSWRDRFKHAIGVHEKASQALETVPDALDPEKKSWRERLKGGLAKTRDKLGKSIAGLFGGGKIDEDLYEELETVLLTADMGIAATEYLLKDVRERVSLKGLNDAHELKDALKDSLTSLLSPLERPLETHEHQPFVILLCGINGAGKTTSIGKLAKYFQSQGKSVLLAAGDTFRAAAREQLAQWGERNGVTVIAQEGGDAAAVCFDAIQSAKAKKIDIVLADTAGRLPTQLHLMDEIRKVKRVIQKADPNAPHEILLVLDANIGQNALAQVKAFDDALGLTGLILTKLDGTAKGGALAAIARERPIPLRFIGVGEGIDDLRPFVAKDYVHALFDE